MDLTQIDHHASYHSPLHPLRRVTRAEGSLSFKLIRAQGRLREHEGVEIEDGSSEGVEGNNGGGGEKKRRRLSQLRVTCWPRFGESLRRLTPKVLNMR